MKHNFVLSPSGLCAQCKRNIIAHTDKAQCESCPNIGECEVIDDILMCASCQARDKEIKVEVGQQSETLTEQQNKVAELVSRLDKEIPIDRRQYFVSQITSIVDIEKQLVEAGEANPQYKLAEIVESHILKMKDMIHKKHEEIRELQGYSIADQRYLNHLVPQLRAEEREKFKAYDISYKPNAVTAPSKMRGPAKPRMSASDKALESYAATLGISVEQAKIAMASALKVVTGAKCTCSETPGMCKVHPKGM